MSALARSAAVLVALLVPLAGSPRSGRPTTAWSRSSWPRCSSPSPLLLMADGLGRQILGDLALVLAVGAFAGSLAYATLLEREP